MLKATRLLIVSIFAVSLSVASFTPARAAEPAVRIAVFDVQKIIDELRVQAPAKSKIEPSRSSEGKGKLSREIQRLKKELEQESLSEEQRKKLVEERNRYREQLRAINEKRWGAGKMQPIATEDDVVAAAARYGEEKGFALLFEKSYWTEGEGKNGVIFTGRAVDISQDIVRRLRAEAQGAEAKQEPQKKAAPTKAPSTKP